jgi:hypothetical protein
MEMKDFSIGYRFFVDFYHFFIVHILVIVVFICVRCSTEGFIC